MEPSKNPFNRKGKSTRVKIVIDTYFLFYTLFSKLNALRFLACRLESGRNEEYANGPTLILYNVDVHLNTN